MIAELGQLTLIIAALLALAQFAFPIYGAWRNNQSFMAMGNSTAYGQFVFVSIALGILTYSFLVQDFSLAYVANNSNSDLPIIYRISAVWGAHEGSLLLWVFIITLWTVAVTVVSSRKTSVLPKAFSARVIAILGLVSFGFLLFVIFTSNPFDRILPAPFDGRDLNPLLQDIGLIIHPPMLYLGYVGFAVAFAFAIAALLGGEINREWVRWARPWTLLAWSFLTFGIALGSWWAYYELGWGGWWFWDPVENASFMPWIVGTALLHAQAVTEKRGSFIGWTLLLSISAFSLSLLGAFLVRSGVITSVHAFASDPTRGVFILMYLGVIVGGSLALYALRVPKMISGSGFTWFSRESLILINNLLLTVALFMVLLGTLYPIIADAFGMGKISVGPPYFGSLFIVIMAPLVMLIPLAAYSRWKQDKAGRVLSKLLVPLFISIAVTAMVAWQNDASNLRTLSGVFAGTWVISGTLRYTIERFRKNNRFTLPRSEFAMVLAHIGVGVFVIGVAMVETTSTEKHLAMGSGDSYTIAEYQFTFKGTEHIDGPNFSAERGTFLVTKNGKLISTMYPEKRQYRNNQIMTEAALDPGFTRDLYVSLGDPLDEARQIWAVRIYEKPFIRWIWLGALMMTFAGLIALSDRRYRRKKTHQNEPSAEPSNNTNPLTNGSMP
ncbi:MAG: heme lyase CcmF/NrfE family subunit [Xanthomonadales bacterium]|nr:heme lyase CcmF/NrfE family subunit [Xanthomonadales bacterium]